MPAKKPTPNKPVGGPVLFDPPGTIPTPTPASAGHPVPGPVMPMAITPRFTHYEGGVMVFDSPVVELIKFGEILLARLENEFMFLTTDGKTWRRFNFEITSIKQEDD